jgi:hypothetical protein
MGSLVLATEGPELRPSAFSALWKKLSQGPDLTGQLVAAEVVRDGKWLNLKSIQTL